ncbi:hypothetical protein PsorP6_004583 [Peronosclerospora sorghi]|uniref:Uncharacterized protein n=1 Tax=Peronosclerospora sorghi TaxID=230839 RepID=A0ACC0VNA4_9STRA|nr:hypothetical protein PsorP6_004583 [Peronosclerospora sorghi]
MTAMRGRMRKEIAMLENDPPFGVSAWPKDDKIDHLEAQILGPDGSPYEKGVFQLEINIPERYPFEPPKVHFVTPIYHPNIDDAGRICLDTLKMQPKGSWLPSVNISTLLTTIRLLMAEPNADDGLMPEIVRKVLSLFYENVDHNREMFIAKATEMTVQHACNTQVRELTPSAQATNSLSEGDKLIAIGKTGPSSKDKQVVEIVSPPKEMEFSDDYLSDGISSSEEEDSETEEGDEDNVSKRPLKRSRQK